MSEYIAFIVIFGLWLSAVIHDAAANKIAWLLVDILVFPLGVIRGGILLLTGELL